jgi:phosphoribosylformylglycinamidine synthase
MSKPSVLIVHAAGTNRDDDAARACELAGARSEIVHINRLRSGEKRFSDYQMLLIPGGFSYGDALGAGTRLALDMQVYFEDALLQFVESGKPVLGICNGFQMLVKAGLLNPPHAGSSGAAIAERSAKRTVTLTENATGHFECGWVHLAVEPGTNAGFLHQIRDLIFCPVAHGEGNFQVADGDALQRLQENGCVALRYVDAHGARANGHYPLNPNGSVADIAGVCNAAGNVLGLMPHPEDHVVPIQNPLGESRRLGLALFRTMIEAIQ